MGQNRRWRTAMVDHITGPADCRSRVAVVLDVACGPARVSRALADATDAYVIGLDLSENMLASRSRRTSPRTACRTASAWCSGEANSCRSPMPPSTRSRSRTCCGTSPTRPQPLAELARVVKPGGPISSLEFAVPTAPWWRIAWWCYTRIVLPIAGWITGGRAWFHVGRFLGPSIDAHYRKYPVDWTVDGLAATPASSDVDDATDEPRRRPDHVGPSRR